MKMIFYFHANKTRFHKNGFALSLVIRKQDILKLGNGPLTEPSNIVSGGRAKWKVGGGGVLKIKLNIQLFLDPAHPFHLKCNKQ